jgi:hypothetical protein
VDTLISGHDEFADPHISKLYAAVFLVTRGPLWSGERWREIWRLNTGYYADIQARSDYL